MEQMDDLRHTLDLTYPAERAVLFDCDGVLVDSKRYSQTGGENAE